MKNNGNHGNHPFSSSCKNSWIRKYIFSAAVRNAWNHITFSSCWQLSLIWIKDKEREGTGLWSYWQKPQITAEQAINNQHACTNIQITTLAANNHWAVWFSPTIKWLKVRKGKSPVDLCTLLLTEPKLHAWFGKEKTKIQFPTSEHI